MTSNSKQKPSKLLLLIVSLISAIMLPLSAKADDHQDLYPQERAYCLSLFADGSDAYRLCYRLKTSVHLSKAERDQLQAELEEARNRLDNISDENADLKAKLNTKIADLEAKTETIEGMKKQVEEVRANFSLYRWQNRMKVVVPVVLGGLAAGYSKDEDRAVNFMAGVGVGFTMEYFGIGLSPYAGKLAYNLSLELGF